MSRRSRWKSSASASLSQPQETPLVAPDFGSALLRSALEWVTSDLLWLI
jgi:hypothetical protein